MRQGDIRERVWYCECSVDESFQGVRNLIDKSQDSFEMQADAIQPGQNVIVVDDLIATGEISQADTSLRV